MFVCNGAFDDICGDGYDDHNDTDDDNNFDVFLPTVSTALSLSGNFHC